MEDIGDSPESSLKSLLIFTIQPHGWGNESSQISSRPGLLPDYDWDTCPLWECQPHHGRASPCSAQLQASVLGLTNANYKSQTSCGTTKASNPSILPEISRIIPLPGCTAIKCFTFQEPSYTAGGDVNWHSHHGGRYGGLPENRKQGGHMAQQSYSLAWIWG